MSETTLASRGEFVTWEPSELSDAQASIISLLCGGRNVLTTDQAFHNLASQNAQTAQEFVLGLLETGLVAKDRDLLVLTTEQCSVVVTPEGIFAAENNEGQLAAWVNRKMEKPKES